MTKQQRCRCSVVFAGSARSRKPKGGTASCSVSTRKIRTALRAGNDEVTPRLYSPHPPALAAWHRGSSPRLPLLSRGNRLNKRLFQRQLYRMGLRVIGLDGQISLYSADEALCIASLKDPADVFIGQFPAGNFYL